MLIVILSILYYFNQWNFRDKSDRWFKMGKEKLNEEKYQEFTPQLDLSWCIPKEIYTGDSDYDPQKIIVIGVNTLNNCCIYNYQGISQCLNKSITVSVCLTSQVGGSIKSLQIEGEYKDPVLYKEAIDDLNKFYREGYNKELCRVSLY